MYNSGRGKTNKNKYASYNEKKYSGYNSGGGQQGMNNQYQNKSYGNSGNNYNNNMYGYDEYMNYSNHASNAMPQNNESSDFSIGYDDSSSYNGGYNNSNYSNLNYNNRNYNASNYNNSNYNNNGYNNSSYGNNGYNNYGGNSNYGNSYVEKEYKQSNYNGNNYSENNGNKASYGKDNYGKDTYGSKDNYNKDLYGNKDSYNKNSSYNENQFSNMTYSDYNYNNTSYGSGKNDTKKGAEYTNINTSYDTNYNYTGYDMGDYDKTAYNDSDFVTSGNYECDITVQTPAKSHTVMEAVFRIILYVFIGVLGGNLLSGPFKSFWNSHIEEDNFLSKIINVVIIIIVVLLSYFIHIVMHEFGHLIGGTLTNYSLISFRVFSVVLTKENKKTTVKKYNSPNSVGECVMMPPEVKKGKYPYKLYRVGGIAMNVITSVVALVLVFGVESFSKYPLNMCGIIYGTVGIVTAIFNGVPVVIGGVPNDGYILLHMTESHEATLAVHSQLLIHAFLSKGGSYSEVPYEQFCISKSGEIKNYLVAKVKLLEYRWHLEHLDFTQAAKCLEATNQYFNSLPKIHQYEINSEKLFVEIMCSNDKDVVDKLFNSDVERFVTEFQNVLAKNRIMMAYEAGVKNNPRAAHKYYLQLKNNVKIYPIKGEANLELTLADYVYEKFCSNNR
ncbi:MAG: hypothetical protein E7262_05315 [Lachnospiraceae bacterium]|nr:hypothetical protein [Lachnospiraceae bacterium]